MSRYAPWAPAMALAVAGQVASQREDRNEISGGVKSNASNEAERREEKSRCDCIERNMGDESPTTLVDVIRHVHHQTDRKR